MWHYWILVLVVLPLTLLMVPIRYNLTGKKNEEITPFFKAEVSWLFGCITFFFVKELGKKEYSCLKLFGFPCSFKRSEGNKKSKKENKKKRMDFRRLLDRDLIAQVIDSVKKIIFHIAPNKFMLEGIIGFDDPYDTFLFFSALNLSVPRHSERFSVNIQSVFDDDVFEGKFLIKGRIVVLYLLYVVLITILSRPVRNILWSMRNIKEAKKDGTKC